MQLVLIIDDSRAMRCIMRDLLEEAGYRVVEADDGVKGLQAIETEKPDVVLLDIEMPHKTGLEVLDELDANTRLFSVVLVSTLSSLDSIVNGLERGADDYIVKPFNETELVARVKAAVRTSYSKRQLIEARISAEKNVERLRQMQDELLHQKQIEEKVREISSAQLATIFAIAKLAECRDEDTGRHLERVREYCRLIAETLRTDSPYASLVDEDFIECIQQAAPLHDIGKIAIPDRVLLKPGKLDNDEFEIMKSHTVIGSENLQMVYNSYPGNVFVGMGIEIALYHHEKWDGSGYPDGLIGKNIPLSARIMALADVYDALRSDRCYRKGMTHEQTKAIILEGDGSHFDPTLIKVFLAQETSFRKIQHEYA